MTLHSLDKILDRYEQQFGFTTVPNQFELLQGLPFYCQWANSNLEVETSKIYSKKIGFQNSSTPNAKVSLQNETFGSNPILCCFNQAIGLPQKNGQTMPMFDYEQLLFDTLQQHKHVWIKKATGLGVTEFMLRYMAWMCVNSGSNSSNKHTQEILKWELRQPNFTMKSLAGSQMCIVTGPRIELAITLIDRMKGLFKNREFISVFDSKETVLELNGVHIEAYPSHHLDSMRGLTNVSFIYLDEADFFPTGGTIGRAGCY